jgi:hypothetical protein
MLVPASPWLTGPCGALLRLLAPRAGLVLRAFCVIEGIALKVDPDYAIVQECMPYLSRRLLTDNNPRMRAALRQLLYGRGNRLDVERLSRMVSALGSFTTASATAQVHRDATRRAGLVSWPSHIL